MTDQPTFDPPVQRMVDGFTADLQRPFDPANLPKVRQRYAAMLAEAPSPP